MFTRRCCLETLKCKFWKWLTGVEIFKKNSGSVFLWTSENDSFWKFSGLFRVDTNCAHREKLLCTCSNRWTITTTAAPRVSWPSVYLLLGLREHSEWLKTTDAMLVAISRSEKTALKKVLNYTNTQSNWENTVKASEILQDLNQHAVANIFHFGFRLHNFK